MSFSLIGIIFLQGYWIYTSWENKEEEFSLSVNTSLREVSLEVKNRELNDYVNAYQMLIDSIGAPSESNFTDVFLFLDEDQSTNLSTFFAYGILEEDYNISIPDNLSSSLSIDQKVKDYKAVKTTILNRNIFCKSVSIKPASELMYLDIIIPPVRTKSSKLSGKILKLLFPKVWFISF